MATPTVTPLADLERTLGDILRARASSDGWVPPSLTGLTSSDMLDMAAIAAEPTIAEAFAPAVLLRGLGALGVALSLTEATPLGAIVAGADVTPDAHDGVNPYAVGTDDWYVWRAGLIGASAVTLPIVGTEPVATDSVPYQRGVLAHRLIHAATLVRQAARQRDTGTVRHAGLDVGALSIAGSFVLQGIVAVVRPILAASSKAIGLVTGTEPLAGGYAEGGTQAAAHGAVSELATAAASVDPVLTRFWLALAALASQLWQEVAGGARQVHTLAQASHALAARQVARLPSPLSVGRAAVLGARLPSAGAARAHAVAGRIATLGGRLHGMDARIGAGRSAAMHTQLGTLHEQLRRQQGQLDTQAARQSELEKMVTAGGGAALFTAGAAAVGADWLKCRNWRNLGRSVCGIPGNILRDLLALALDFLVLESICVLIPLLEAAASEVGVPLVEGLAAVVGAGTCGGYGRGDPLRVPRLYLPPVVPLTLHLPA